ncbi:hypothetical protein MRB53_039559 [Persea americana]|nr:hypothetical protein MRB53_039559 [Persea americana]
MSGKNSIDFLLNDNGSDVTRLPNSTTKPTASNFTTTSHLLQQQQRPQQPSNSSIPQYFLNTHSRSSSNSSTPLQTPQLIRSDSSDSRASVFATLRQ